MTRKKEHVRKVWALVVGIIPIVLSWGLSTGSNYTGIPFLLGTVLYMVLFFIKRPCNELVPAVGYAISFLLLRAVGPGIFTSSYAPLIFDPIFVGRAFLDELSVSLHYALILFAYIPISFALCMLTGLVFFLFRIVKAKKAVKVADD